MKKLLTLFLGLVLCVGLFGQTQSNDAYETGWLTRKAYTGFLNQNGTVPLTADWANPAFSISALNLTATPTVGNEALTNVAGWTAAGNWTYAAATGWSHATGSATALTATGETAVAIGTKYEIVMTLTTSVAGGGITVSLGGQSFAVNSATGVYTYNVTALSTAALAITPTAGTWVGALTISVKILAANTGIVNAEGIVLNSGQLLLPNGNGTYLSMAFNKNPNLGIAIYANSYFGIYTPSSLLAPKLAIGDSYVFVLSSYLSFSTTADLSLSRNSAATLQLGAAAAAPIDQTIMGSPGVGSDKPGGALALADGPGTGAGVGVGTKIQTSFSLPIAATASTVQTRYTRKWEVSKTWAIVDAAAAVPIITITCPAGAFVNGKVVYSLEVINNDGTEMQCESGDVTFAALQHAAGAAYHIVAPSEVSTQNLSSGTLTSAWTMTSGADVVVLNFASDSNLTMTGTARTWLRIQIILNSPQTITLN